MSLLRNVGADSRMRDIELALRYYGYLYNKENYKGNLRLFLDNTCKMLNEQWEENKVKIKAQFKDLEKSIEFCYDIFEQKHAFSKWERNEYNNRFNRALFEVFTYYFSDMSVRASVGKKQFEEGFKELCDTDSSFIESISSTTKETKRVEKRFLAIEELLDSLIPDLTKRY